MSIVNDWAGWLLLFFSFFLVSAFREIRKDGRLAITVWIVLAFHHVIALINAYLFTVTGAETDAATFHRLAAEWAANGDWHFTIGGYLYPMILGSFYRFFGPSHFFGEELSNLAFVLSCIVLIKLINLLDLRRFRIGLVAIFGLLPTMQILTSVTLRESYQILFFMLSVYWGLRFHLKSSKGTPIFLILSVLLMGFFHHGLFVFALFLAPLILFWHFCPVQYRWISFKWSKRRMISIGIIIVFLIVGIIIGGKLNIGVLSVFHTWNPLQYIETFRAGSASVQTRATYEIMLDTSSWVALTKSVSLSFFYYLFAPFPWQVSNLLDFYGMFESLLRFVLIAFSVIAWHRGSGTQRRAFGLLLIIYFSMTFLWAMGTTNYGTAIRHNLVNYWIIVLLGGPGLISFIVRLLRTILPVSRVKSL